MRLKDRIGQNVLDDHALAPLQGRAAGCGAFLNAVEVIQKFLLKAALRDDLQRAGSRVIELYVAKVGVEQGNSRIKDFLEQRLELRRHQQPCAKFVEASHSRQLGGQFVLCCHQRLSAGDELLSQSEYLLGPASKLPLYR